MHTVCTEVEMSDNKVRFTKASIEALSLPNKGSRFYWDDRMPGLAIRVTAGGARTFYVYRKVKGKPEQIRIGPYPDLSVELARKQAAEILAQIAMGEDPIAKRREERAAKTFEELFAWYLEQPKKNGPRSPKTIAEYQKQFRLHLGTIANRLPNQITERDFEALFRRIGKDSGPYMANRVLALVRAVYNMAIRKGLIRCPNPAAGIESFAEVSRERRLLPHEIEQFLEAVASESNETMRDYVLLSLYTGARKSNVLAMRWDEISFEGKTWRIPLTKNGTAQTIPLEDAEIVILKRRSLAVEANCPWVFPGTGTNGHLADPKSGWKRILDRANINDLRIHDLRRSLASFMVDSGASMPVIGKTLNHKSPATTSVYARTSLDPVRIAKRAAHGAMHMTGLSSEQGKDNRKSE
jgi:integrase